MPFYKYCDAPFDHVIASGSIRLCSLAWFRHLEADENDSIIGDQTEGQTESVIDRLELGANVTDDQLRTARNGGISITIGNREPAAKSDGVAPGIVITNARMRRDAGHWLIFCFSETTAPVPAQFNYDAYVEICDPEAFKDAILKTGSIDRVSLNDLFHVDQAHFGKVTYAARVSNAADEEQLEPNPMVKPERYRGQTEYRLALLARDPMMRDAQIVRFTPPAGVFKTADDKPSKPIPTNADERAAITKELLELIRLSQEFGDRTSELAGEAMTRAGNDPTARRNAYTATVEPRRQLFVDTMRVRIMRGYWRARMYGVRGDWEAYLSVARSPLDACIDLAKLVECLWPGSAPRTYHPDIGWKLRYPGRDIDPTSGPTPPD